jgi:hypothetical protein
LCRYAEGMLPSLTVQQRAQRCRCGRLLAWAYRAVGTQWACLADPICCRCFRPSHRCPCEATSDVAEGCHGLDLAHVHEPEDDNPDCE